MNISLERPLVVFDIEATGLSITQDRIVEIAALKIDKEGNRREFLRRVNPEMQIPEEAIAIHGISNDDIKDAPTFKDILQDFETFVSGCDIAGYNSNKFDLPLLAEELLRCGSELDLSKMKHIDVQNIFHKMEQRTLIAAYAFYCNKQLKDAHSAMADASATLEVLDAQIGKYDDLNSDVDFLSEFSRYGDTQRVDFAGRLALNKKKEVIYNFGKHRNKTVEEVAKIEPGYYGWMLDADFPLYTKQCLRKEMERIRAKKKNSAKEHGDNEENFNDKLDALKNKFKK